MSKKIDNEASNVSTGEQKLNNPYFEQPEHTAGKEKNQHSPAPPRESPALLPNRPSSTNPTAPQEDSAESVPVVWVTRRTRRLLKLRAFLKMDSSLEDFFLKVHLEDLRRHHCPTSDHRPAYMIRRDFNREQLGACLSLLCIRTLQLGGALISILGGIITITGTL